MGKNRLAIASVLFLALLGVTLWVMNQREQEVSRPVSADIELPEVDKAQVDTLEIGPPDKPKVKLVKAEEGWRLSEPVDAEADQAAVEAALTKLAELEVTGVAATNDKNHGLLEVTEDKSTRVVAKQGDSTLLDAHIGRYSSGSTALRKEGDVQVASVKGSIRYAFDKETRQWRNREITKVESGDVTALVLNNDKGELHFVKEGDEWKQAEGQPEIEDFDPSKVKSLIGSATSLRAVDFAEEGVTPEQAGLGEAAKGSATLILGGDAGPQEIVYRIGNKKDANVYLTRQGVETIFLVSSWIADRLTSGPEGFRKKAEAEAQQKPPNVIEAKPIPRPDDLVPVGKIQGAGKRPPSPH